MKKHLIFLWMIPASLVAQTFKEVKTEMNNFAYSAVDTSGDIDGDGKKDIILNGAIDTDNDGKPDTTFNEIYTNDGASIKIYDKFRFGTDATHTGDIKFIDWDNDGLSDVVSTGLSYNDIVNYKHYRFKNTGNGFEKIYNGPGKVFGSIEVFDFNHDGKLDYAINGAQYMHKVAINKIGYYQNTGNGTFQQFPEWADGTQEGGFKMVDLNNDNFLDMVVSGLNENSEPLFKVYLGSKDGKFSLSQTLIALSGKIQVADFDADGYQDVLIVGEDENGDRHIFVCMNDTNASLTPYEITTKPISDASVSVGDLNNDGYYDFIISGNDENYNAYVGSFIYNPKTKSFNEGVIDGVKKLGGGFVHLFDYDEDHHLDILHGGFDWEDEKHLALTKLFKNTSVETNEKPKAPTNLNIAKSGNRFNFSWNGASDDKTPTKALQYEITVGTKPGASDIAKYIVTTSHWFLDLDPSIQKVYWSVRSIDASKTYSDASETKTLGVSDNIGIENQIELYPNPASERVYIRAKNITEVEIYSMDGKRLRAVPDSQHSVDISHLPKGTYIFRLYSKDAQTISKKLIIK